MRLELTRRGDYGVRAMLALAKHGGMLTGPRISDVTGVPSSFVPQVMGALVRAGLVEARQGRNGGYRLALPAVEVTLLSVVEAIEGDSRRKTCILRGGPCNAEGRCQVHDAFFAAQEALLAELRRTTLASLTR